MMIASYMGVVLVLDAPGGGADAEVGYELRQGDLGEARFCLSEGGSERRIHRLLNETGRMIDADADREQRRRAEGVVDLAQGDLVEVGGQLPTAAPALFRADEAGAAYDHRVGVHVRRQFGRGHRTAGIGHVQQRVQYRGKTGVVFHVTSDVTL